MGNKNSRSMSGAKEFKKYYKTDRKSKKVEKLDKLNPARAYARIVDDEYTASNSDKYDEELSSYLSEQIKVKLTEMHSSKIISDSKYLKICKI